MGAQINEFLVVIIPPYFQVVGEVIGESWRNCCWPATCEYTAQFLVTYIHRKDSMCVVTLYIHSHWNDLYIFGKQCPNCIAVLQDAWWS